jgi:hypothetical protein
MQYIAHQVAVEAQIVAPIVHPVSRGPIAAAHTVGGMSRLSKLIGMASKALDGRESSARPTSGGDWRSMVRSAADAITGDERQQQSRDPRSQAQPSAPAAPSYGAPANPRRDPLTPPPAGTSGGAVQLSAADRQAVARYDYLLQTADPHQVEQIHREAFARLTPEQRVHVQARMSAELPASERPRSADAADLARTAARTEASRPGMLKGLLARAGGGRSAGRMVGGAALAGGAAVGVGVLGAVAGGAVLSSVAGPFLAQAGELGVDFDAWAQGIDLEGLTGGVEGLAGDALAGAGDHVSGLGEQVSGFGEQLGGFELPGLGDIFGR